MNSTNVQVKTNEKKANSLEFALDFEIKGANMYLKLAAKTKNALGKSLFYSLAAEEVEHAKKIDEIYQGIRDKKDLGVIEPVKSRRLQVILKRLFSQINPDELRKDADNFSGYRLAMKMERKGYEAYEEFYNKAKIDAEKEFFSRLMNEEKEHLSALANVYSFLTRTDDWFQEEESKVWNWMNS